MPAVEVLCVYRVSEAKAAAFETELKKHWPALHRAGLATDTPAKAWITKDRKGKSVFIERFAWKNESSPDVAHDTPSVMQVWEPMGALTEGDMEFFHMKELKL